MSKEYILGYFAAQLVDSAHDQWSAARRRSFLIDQSVEVPFTVDPAASTTLRRYSSPHCEVFGKAMVVYSEDIDAESSASTEAEELPLWPCLPVLEQSIACTAGDRWADEFRLYAVTRFSSVEIGTSFTKCYRFRIKHAQDPNDFVLLGYDVANRWLLSALLNCSYGDNERRDASRFAICINKHHLFDSALEAERFATWSDVRLPDHGEFFVHALRQVHP